ncbi:hypothetical protein DWB85_15395 [Seongchinamella sediminis]|uniref:Uncharacterized protein n=1 Tax=Seongchinamella sediminis TaxID=2283635 RepID=A0A3L7DWK8_9GAMM|nr:hypothetical protein [Seongchinamella sediminis]RLQ20949.1 hypothetical protein DWB85_15395 [Seongchinamella sediminis]
MEQHSNAIALRQLGYASTTAVFDHQALEQWLADPYVSADIRFPDVAPVLAEWLATGCEATPASLSARLWQTRGPARMPAPQPGGAGRRLPAVP